MKESADLSEMSFMVWMDVSMYVVYVRWSNLVRLGERLAMSDPKEASKGWEVASGTKTTTVPVPRLHPSASPRHILHHHHPSRRTV